MDAVDARREMMMMMMKMNKEDGWMDVYIVVFVVFVCLGEWTLRNSVCCSPATMRSGL